jgi:HK97 gp10 family phage protein
MREIIGFELRGVADLRQKLLTVGPEIATKGGAIGVRAGNKHLEKLVVAAAPRGDADTSRTYTVNGGTETRTVDYGHLFENIRVRKGKPQKEYNQVSLIGTGSAFWGYFLEFGTERIAPQPWMGPAIKAGSQGALDALVKSMHRYLDRQLKKMGG